MNDADDREDDQPTRPYPHTGAARPAAVTSSPVNQERAWPDDHEREIGIEQLANARDVLANANPPTPQTVEPD